MRAPIPCLVVVAAAFGWPLSGQAQPPSTPWTAREVPLGPAGDVLAQSSDRSQVARLVRGGGKARIFVDSAEIGVQGGVVLAGFNPDGKRFVYATKEGNRLRLFVDGVLGWEGKGPGLFGSVHTFFSFSRSGTRWFLVTGHRGFSISSAQRPGRYALIVDGQAVADDVDAEVMASADGSRFGYLAKAPGAPGRETRTLVLHGPEGERSEYQGLGPASYWALSPDGKRIAFTVLRDERWRLVVDGVESGAYEEVGPPAFSSDGRRLAFAARRSGKWLVVLDEQGGARYQEVGAGGDDLGSLCFSADGTRLAYTARRRGAWVAVLDGVESQEFDAVGRPVLGHDGRHVAYPAKKGGRWFVVADGTSGTPYEEVANLLFSAEGNRLAYTARSSGRWVVVVDGREGVPYDEVARPALSPQGEHFAYAAKRSAKWFLVVDGTEGREYAFLKPRALVFDGPREFHALIERKDRLFDCRWSSESRLYLTPYSPRRRTASRQDHGRRATFPYIE